MKYVYIVFENDNIECVVDSLQMALLMVSNNPSHRRYERKSLISTNVDYYSYKRTRA